MLVLTAFLMAFSAAVAAVIAGSLLRSPPSGLRVRNFRGLETPVLGGVVIVGAYLAGEALLAVVALLRTGSIEAVGIGSPSAVQQTFLSFDHLGILALALGFFLLGTIDDLAGRGHDRGFKGHFLAIRQGRLTGGTIKALGGGALAFVVSALWELNLLPAVIDALVIALLANLLNLLDLRPGRATKVFLAIWLPLGIAAWNTPFLPISAMPVAAAAVWLWADLAERGMLGDAGANMLGALLGAGLILVVSLPGRIAALLLLFLLTLLSEKKSFTELIDSISPLRWLDRIGRRPPYS